ncbi:MAG: DUF721 domain-containing protein [Actinomycetota bacterium]|nr:DUF721 domain-containing protein [Actinomycetota bacterium]
MSGKDGTSLGRALGSFLRRAVKGGRLAAARVASAWPQACGPQIAEHTAGIFIRGRELVVYVDSPIWANELAAMSEHLRVAVNSVLGEELVSSIRFTVSRKVVEEATLAAAATDKEALYNKDKVDPVPVTEAERAQIEREASVIGDEGLREAAINAQVRDYEWKKGSCDTCVDQAGPLPGSGGHSPDRVSRASAISANGSRKP